ncbi:Pimeloyl-ACP methyl ester carboxylesterase [Ekhidna lutea]|uniref:Pimeloyl-ACP methyl ester carboxylesterase n=1 Tax=Ekhidna lutea TaxID=447679 RepID=A0A239LLG3_EKHLU|nr:alpha/beta hydrolase [Ekhidna lutea]SNT31416.1 Pimeloyl-ACP methyl ester carboxylesterase [Ekhidna lutea]
MRLVCLHGNSSSPAVFNDLRDVFEDVHTITFPGHGGDFSSNPESDYSLDELRAFAIRHIPQDEPFLLIGNSLGGHIAIEVTPQLKNCVGLVFFASPPLKRPLNIEEAFMPTDILGIFLEADYTQEVIENAMKEIAVNEKVWPLLLSDFKNTDPKFREILGKSILNGELMDEIKILEKLSVPAYVIHGKQDPTPNIDYIKKLKGINKIFQIDQCGHYASIEAPKKFNDIIKQIIQEVEND